MTLFLLLTTVCLVIGTRSAFALAKQRFPSPVDLACVSLIYYTLPLSIAGYFYLNYGNYIFLNRYAGDQSLAFQSMVYLTVALLSLTIGRAAGRFMGEPRTLAFVPLSRATEIRAEVALAGLIGLVGFGIALFGVADFALGYATESTRSTAAVGNALIYWAVESSGLAIMLAVMLRRYHQNPRLAILVVGMLIVLAIVFIVRAKRLEIVAALLPVGLLLLSRRVSFKMTVKRIAAVCVGVAALILISSMRVKTSLDVFYSTFYLFSEGLYAGHTLPGIIDRTSSGALAYEYGVRFANGVLAFIPSFLWEGKEDLLYAGNTQLQSLAPQGATNILAEVVLQGGFPAVVLTFFIMGLIFHRLTVFSNSWDSSTAAGFVPFRFGLYVIAIAIFIPHFRDGIIPMVKLTLQAVVFLGILVGGNLVVKSLAAGSAPSRRPWTNLLGRDGAVTSRHLPRELR